jgi:dipeptidyl aminopeptidase/acylaminoacyl peptidase
MPVAPYASWLSPISSDLIVAQSITLPEVRIDRGRVYWLEGRPQERGRYVVVAAEGGDLTPAPFNVRTRVHEYGGGAWTVANGVLYFSNFADGRLYVGQALSPASPQPLTPEGPFRYADLLIDPQGRIIAVREDHSGGSEPVNTIVRIDPSGRAEILAQGHDFCSTPRLSPDGRHFAYLAWDHPRMPWDGTELYLDGTRIAGGPAESVFQPEFSPDGASLFFVSDRTGWWNLYRYDLAGGDTRAIAPMSAEFGEPQWVFGMSTYAFAGPDRLVCTHTENGLGRLAAIDLKTGAFTPVDTPYTDFSSVRAEGDRVVFRAGSPKTPAAIVTLDLATGKTEVLKQATSVADDPAISRCLTVPRAIEYPSGNRTAHGLFYPAFHPDYTAPEGDRPPLVVKCHGGPTAAASSTLDLRIQYWTSRGISVLDVNYGGSTGFGRPYRKFLNGQWGIVDVDDAVNGARHLAAEGLVDGGRCVITGGSAGGYTALAALTFRDFFRGGASHYGVSDLAVLARDTHKFESRYLDTLIGPYPAREDLYRERSPLAHADRLNAPVIFFQGDEDQVVPPNQTELMVDALRAKGAPVGYLLFAGEQHGFRQAANIKRALDAELLFYAVNVFGTGLYF